jgi:hypothetical protein
VWEEPNHTTARKPVATKPFSTLWEGQIEKNVGLGPRELLGIPDYDTGTAENTLVLQENDFPLYFLIYIRFGGDKFCENYPQGPIIDTGGGVAGGEGGGA